MATLAGQMQTAAAEAAAALAGGATPTLAAMQAITVGSLSIVINGQQLVGNNMDFSGAASLPACATIIGAVISAQGSCTWSSTHFVITSHISGPESSVTFATGSVAVPALLRSGDGGTITAGASPLGPQWIPCDGRVARLTLRAGMTPDPVPGTPSTGTRMDYWRRVGRWGGASGILPGAGFVRIPRDPTAQYYVSVADSNSEATLTNPYTVQRPPPGVV